MVPETKQLQEGSSGVGNSFQSDWQRCPRYFHDEHRHPLVHRAVDAEGKLVEAGLDEAVALTVGKAGHAWLEGFYQTILDGASLSFAIKTGDEMFEKSAAHVASQIGDFVSWDMIQRDDKFELARMVLKARARVLYERQQSGAERTIALEQYQELALPGDFYIPTMPGHVFVIRHTCGREESDYPTRDDCLPDKACLRRYTVRIDRVFEDARQGVLVEDYKFTGWSSPKSFAEEELMTDQSTRYVYVWNSTECDRAVEDHDLMRGVAEGVRYSVFRLQKSLTASSFHEEVRLIDTNQLSDSWMRLCLERAEMSRIWDYPREMWQANRYAHGPCVKFGRYCKFSELCNNPGDEENFISDGGQTSFWRKQ